MISQNSPSPQAGSHELVCVPLDVVALLAEPVAIEVSPPVPGVDDVVVLGPPAPPAPAAPPPPAPPLEPSPQAATSIAIVAQRTVG